MRLSWLKCVLIAPVVVFASGSVPSSRRAAGRRYASDRCYLYSATQFQKAMSFG
jgi:hypothetical protein